MGRKAVSAVSAKATPSSVEPDAVPATESPTSAMDADTAPRTSTSPVRRGSSIAGKAYWAMVRRVTLTAAAIDAMYIPLFLWLGSLPLALINLAGIALYGAAYWLIGRRHNGLGLVLIWSEVLVHTLLGSLLVGWDSGFHYFLLMFIPAIVIANTRGQAVPMVLLLLAYYLGLQSASQHWGPLTPLSPNGLRVLNGIHIALVFGMSAALAGYYRSTILAAERRLLRLATVDSLTRLNNRSHFQTLAAAELARARRTQEPVALVLCDVDHFKNVNDRYGHSVGDQALVHVAQVLSSNLRECDVLARWGGEEFLALLPMSDLPSAQTTAERIRQAINNTPLPIDGATLPLTLSLGVAQVHGADDLQAAIVRADKALYRSKQDGRNRVSVG